MSPRDPLPAVTASPTRNVSAAPSSGANPVTLVWRTLLLLAAADRKGALVSPDTYVVEVDLGAGWQRATLVGAAMYVVDVPKAQLASLREIKVRYKPAKTYWQVNGTLQVGSPWALKAPASQPPDTPQALDDMEEATSFYPIWQGYDTTGTAHIIYLAAIFSQVRDATDVVLKKIQSPPPSRQNQGGESVAEWGPLPVAGYHFLGDRSAVAPASQILTGTSPKTVYLRQEGSVAPQCWDRVLALRDEAAIPRLYAVSCPTRLDSLAASGGKLPVLVFIHSDMQQNVPAGFYEGDLVKDQEPYPWGWDYLYYGLYRYMRYTSDPSSGGGAYSKGLPYQVADAGRSVMTVLPLNRASVEVAPLMDGSYLLEMLEELTAYVMRRKEIGRLAASDPVGDVALGAFSAGCAWIPKFLDKNAKLPFGVERLKEVYSFEAAFGDLGKVVTATTDWSAADPARIVRIYTQSAVIFAGLTGQGAIYNRVPPPYDVTSADGNRTTVVITNDTWARTVGRKADFQDAHQLTSALCVSDAIYRSRFPT